jgi:hypothetical protein
MISEMSRLNATEPLRIVIDWDTLEPQRLSVEEARTYLAEHPNNVMYEMDEDLLSEVNRALEAVKDAFRAAETVLAKAEVKLGLK